MVWKGETEPGLSRLASSRCPRFHLVFLPFLWLGKATLRPSGTRGKTQGQWTVCNSGTSRCAEGEGTLEMGPARPVAAGTKSKGASGHGLESRWSGATDTTHGFQQ